MNIRSGILAAGRRVGLIGILAAAVTVSLIASVGAEPAAKKRRLIFNWDGCMAYTVESNPLDKKPFASFPISQEQFLGYVVDPFMSKPVDSLFYCIGSGNVFTTRMETADRFGQYLKPITTGGDGLSQYVPAIVSQCRRFWSEGTDDLEMVVGRVHKAGREVFASFRMNDTHFTSPKHYLKGYEIEWCKFNRDNPQFNISGPKSKFDYAHQEVRDWRFRHIEEICRKWDVDGVELDFYRYPKYFKRVTPGNTRLMTQFVGRVRKMLDELGKKRGRPILLAVRTLPNQELSLSIGLDPNEWIKRGWLDLLITGSGYMVMDSPVEGFVKATRDTRCQVYNCINHYRPNAFTRAWAANSWAKGVDGLYLFNWCEQRAFDSIMDKDPIWEQITSPAKLVGTSKLFVAERLRDMNVCGSQLVWKPSAPLPIQLSSEPATFEILASEDIQASGSVPHVSLRLTIRGEADSGNLTVRFNGRELTPGNIPSTPDRRALAATEMVASKDKWLPYCDKSHKPTHEFPVPADALVNGRNRIQIALGGDRTVTLVSAAIFVDYSKPSVANFRPWSVRQISLAAGFARREDRLQAEVKPGNNEIQ